MADWVSLDSITPSILSGYDYIHCDTRDFNILGVVNKNPHNIQIPEHLTESEYVYSPEEIIENLNALFSSTGGTRSWRMLKSYVFHPEYPTWIKYIRFARINDKPEFIPYISHGDDNTLLLKSMLNTKNVFT